MNWIYDDGGRATAGYKGAADDCVCRAIAITSQQPYQKVYDALNELAATERLGKRMRRWSSARTGVRKGTTRRYLKALGWRWVATMQIGQGCTTHLKASELPAGRLIVKVSKHFVAVIDGIIHDTHNPSRGGTRCVYGYWVES